MDALAPRLRRHVVAALIVAIVSGLARGDEREHAVTYVRDAAVALDAQRRIYEVQLELARQLHRTREYERSYDARAELRRLEALRDDARRRVAEARAAMKRRCCRCDIAAAELSASRYRTHAIPIE